MPTVAYIGAQQVLALISICNRDYVIQGWHGALLTMAIVLAAIFFNTTAVGKLPVLEGLAVVLHVFGFFAFIVILWVMGSRADAKETFTVFKDDNNWGSVGLATLIAMVAPATTYLGGDSAVHLSEELKDASYVLPRAMASAAVINYVLGFVTTVTLMFNLGSVKDDLADPSAQPWVAIIYRITGSKPATIVLIIIMIVMYFFCAVNQVTTSSRQVFAFARDKGLPFHRFLSKVRPGSGVPANAVYVTLVFTCLLALVQIGSIVAFNIVLTISSTGLFTSYICCIACVLRKRIVGEQFPASKFSLGKFGFFINIFAICFLCLAYVFLFFPSVPNPDPASMNWGILIYGVAVLFAIGYYFFIARHVYEGPVSKIDGRKPSLCLRHLLTRVPFCLGTLRTLADAARHARLDRYASSTAGTVPKLSWDARCSGNRAYQSIKSSLQHFKLLEPPPRSLVIRRIPERLGVRVPTAGSL